ncbi:hypothetical protein H9P43_004915 [Blastocladiella emersonii ATCC 22665]|nr:hypothetical protein H9P43_004915 [Blastocladiella emersonii ATCC 22665]
MDSTFMSTLRRDSTRGGRRTPWLPPSPTKHAAHHHSTARSTVADFLHSSQRFLNDAARRMVTEEEAVRALRREHDSVLQELKGLDPRRVPILPRAGEPSRPPPSDRRSDFPTVEGKYFRSTSSSPAPWADDLPPPRNPAWSATLETAREDLIHKGISGIYSLGRPAARAKRPETPPPGPEMPPPLESVIFDVQAAAAEAESAAHGEEEGHGDRGIPDIRFQSPEPLDVVGEFRRAYSGNFIATASPSLVLLGGGRAPADDDPPVKVRIPAAVAAELQAYRKPTRVQSRSTYNDEASMALNDHLHSGCRPNLYARPAQLNRATISLRGHLAPPSLAKSRQQTAWAPHSVLADPRSGEFGRAAWTYRGASSGV